MAVHIIVLVALVALPRLPIFQPSAEDLQRREELLRRIRDNENRTFVFVQPRVDLEAETPPERANPSDLDRRAATPERAPTPLNTEPFARGNSPERTESADARRGPESPSPPAPEPPQPETQIANARPPVETGPRRELPPPVAQSGALGEALKNLQRYVQNESFENPQGGANEPGASIQFDTKGVEFGPWLRRFVAQVRRNWFIPLAAFSMHGRVVLQFNIWKDGRITDIAIVGPSDIGAFNNAAVNAIRTSNPTQPLPPEYPVEKAFFTVTFYYNESPPN